MSDIVLVAIVGFAGIIGTGVLSPLVLGWLNARSRIREKEEDAEDAAIAKAAEWKRQDEVAAKAAAVALEAKKAGEAAAEAAMVQAEASRTLIGKIDVVHTLVNSQMTSAMQAEMDATTRELALMRELADMRHVAHPGVATPAVDRAIALTIDRLNVLGAALSDRHLAADQVADQERAAVRQGIGSPGDPTPL